MVVIAAASKNSSSVGWSSDEATREKLESRLDKMAEEAIKGKTGLDIRRIIEVIDFMSEHKGARPRYNEKTDEIWYEPPPDF